LGRPEHFASHEEAFNFYRGKRAFGRFSDEVLWDYVHASKSTLPEGGVQLSFPAAWEAAVYGSAPWVWPRLLRVRLPTLGLRGEHSDVLTPGAMRRWARLQPSAELHHCPGGHLLPMESPETTAGYVIDFLQRHPG
jgi:pimeloyl-ACP methyl ester carboxylesterase